MKGIFKRALLAWLFVFSAALLLFPPAANAGEETRQSRQGTQSRLWIPVKGDRHVWRVEGMKLNWQSTDERAESWILSAKAMPSDWVFEAKFSSSASTNWPAVLFSVDRNLRNGYLLSLDRDLTLSRIEDGRVTSQVAKVVDTHAATMESQGMRERAAAEESKLRSDLGSTRGPRSIKLLKTGDTYAYWVDGLLISTVSHPGHNQDGQSKDATGLPSQHHYYGFALRGKGSGTVSALAVRPAHLAQKHGGNPILKAGPDGAWDDAVIWSKHIIREGGIYYLYFGGRNKKSKKDGGSVGVATSRDLVRWTKHPGNPVLDEDSPKARPWESHTLLAGDVVRAPDGRFALLYNGHDGKAWRGVGLAFADSPLGPFEQFEKNPVLAAGESGKFDSRWIHEHGVLRQADGTYALLYTGYPSPEDETNAKLAIEHGGDLKGRPGDHGGLATSMDLVRWEKHAANPVFELGPVGAWDDGHVRPGTIAKLGEWHYMFYEGAHFDGRTWVDQIGAARSKDLVHWQRFPYNPIIPVGVAGSPADIGAAWPAAVVADDRLLVFYFCVGKSQSGICKSTISPETVRLWDAK